MITPQLVQELLLVGTGGVLPQAYHPLKLHRNLVGTGGGGGGTHHPLDLLMMTLLEVLAQPLLGNGLELPLLDAQKYVP